MPIAATCSNCGHKYNLIDEVRGKAVKCKACGSVFTVPKAPPAAVPVSATPLRPAGPPAAIPVATSQPPRPDAIRAAPGLLPAGQPALPVGDDLPRSRRRTDEDDFQRARPLQRPQPNMVLIGVAAGGGLLALALVAIISVMVVSSFRSTPQQLAADDRQEKKIEGPAVKQADAGGKREPANDDLPPPRNVAPNWKVVADPGPAPKVAPAAAQAVTPLGADPHVVVPSSSSPFVAVRHGQESWSVFDMLKGQVSATVNGRHDLNDESLSPDGQFLAGRTGPAPHPIFRRGKGDADNTKVGVFSFAKNQVVQQIPVNTAGAAFGWADFAEKGHIITIKNRAGKGVFEVWDSSGKAVRQFEAAGMPERNKVVFSPGRKFAALVLGERIAIYQPLTGELCGELNFPPPGDIFRFNVGGLAFSADGLELALYLEKFPGQSRLLTWDMQTGQLAANHIYSQHLSNYVGNPRGFRGLCLDWLPDRSGWLLYGQVILDYRSGAPLHKIAGFEDSRINPRRMVGTDHVLTVSSGAAQNAISVISLPKDEIAGALERIRTGGGTPVTALPPPRHADLSAMKSLPPPVGKVAWKVPAAAAPAADGPLAPLPIALQAAPQDVIQTLFSTADAAQAVVLSNAQPIPLKPTRALRADRFNLLTGQPLGSFDLFSVDEKAGAQPLTNTKADLSPDGARLAIQRHDDRRRIDIWNLADGKHLVGFVPNVAGHVDYLAFIDGSHLLVAAQNRIMLWKVPECRAVYTVSGYSGLPHLSAGRKVFAALAGASLEIVDAVTGARLGQLGQPGGAIGAVHGVAFSKEGAELAASLTLAGKTSNQLARWKLTDASWAGSVNAGPGNSTLLFVGPQHLLHGLTLYDWDLKSALWQYTAPNPSHFAASSPDERCWLAFKAGETSVLLAQTLPDAQAIALAGQIIGAAVEPLALPGASVQISVNAANERFSTEVEKSLQRRMALPAFARLAAQTPDANTLPCL